MPTPTAFTVSVDSTEYCRYEENYDTITASVIASGGAPYSSVPVRLELVKARRSRDAVAGEVDYTLTAPGNNAEFSVVMPINDFVDGDLINLVRHGRYFVRATYDATQASAQIGSGPNNTITVLQDAGAAGNSWTIEVTVPAGTSGLNVDVTGTAITVELSVSGGVPVAGDNTGILVLNALQAEGFSATVSGDGTDNFTLAEGPTSFTGGTDTASGESEDFDIRIMTVDRFKKDFLFGIDLKSTAVLGVKFPPTQITGISVTEVSSRHPTGLYSLVYNTSTEHENATATIGSGANGTVTITAENTLQGEVGNVYSTSVIVPAGTSGLSASLTGGTLEISLDVIAGVPNPAANTATLVAAAIDALDDFSAVASGTGADSIGVAESDDFSGGSTTTIRTLSWAGGTAKSITGPGNYILPKGTSGPAAKLLPSSSARDYIIVRVGSLASLPSSSISEDLLIDRQEISDETLCNYLDEAVAYVENDFLNIYLEPTNLVTDRDPTTIQYTSGINAGVPIFEDPDYDFIVNPLTYFVPVVQGRWVQIQTPYQQLLRVDSLFGAIADTRVITIDLSWVEHSEQGGLIQLVPFNQETAFDFLGLIWVNAIRGATEIPNFWHFNLIAGLRDCPAELREYVGKYAAINALTQASLAFRPGLGSLSLSRDGVSESTSFNTAATYGAFSGAIQSFKDWMEQHEKRLRAKYRGARMVVV